MTMTLICLAIIFGMSVAALVGGYRKYMFYRTDTLPNGFKYRTWYAHIHLMQPPSTKLTQGFNIVSVFYRLGWYKYSNSTFRMNTYAPLKVLPAPMWIILLYLNAAAALSGTPSSHLSRPFACLQSLSMGAYILGLVTAGFLGGSALLALLFMLFTCCGRSRSLACIALPGS